MNICYWVVLPDVITETVVSTESFVAKLAREILLVLLVVSPAVLYQIFTLRENLPTEFTAIVLARRGLLVSSVTFN